MVNKKNDSDEKLQKLLLDKNVVQWDGYDEKKVFSFAKKYVSFLSKAKSQRVCFSEVVSNLKKSGFKDGKFLKKVVFGDKIFFTFKQKTLCAFVVGKDPLALKLIGSHMDAPHLDLKPNPLVEDSGFGLLKTHYYGGIKKYQWVNTPLSLQGIVHTKKGKKLMISLGDKEGDPKFVIPDLLPHLDRHQMERKTSSLITGEELKILVGSIPLKNTDYAAKVKLAILKKLYDEFGITEQDFVGADLELIPSLKPFDVGFDRSLIGAYAHDDRSCVFTSLQAIVNIKNSKKTAACFFVDKEEVGSVGSTGAASFLLRNFAQQYINLVKPSFSVDKFLQQAFAVSADVAAGMNPLFKDVHDATNAPYLGKGPVLSKYKGVGGKSYTDEATSEYVSYIKSVFNKGEIAYQAAEGGKIDLGGGGTIAMYMSRYGMDVIDVGPAVLSMHSPCEVISKIDLYLSYLFYKEFLSSL